MKVHCSIQNNQCYITDIPQSITSSTFSANAYLSELLQRGYHLHTVRAYAYCLKSLMEFCFEKNIDIARFDSKIVCFYYGWLRANSNLSDTSSRVYILKAVKFIKYLTTISSNINLSLDSFSHLSHFYSVSNVQARVKKRKDRLLQDYQIITLLNETTNIRDYLLLYMLYETGMRISEVLSLQLDDIELIDKSITITDRGLLPNGASVKTPSGERTIHCSTSLFLLIEAYLNTYQEIGNNNRFLFVKIRGLGKYNPMTYHDVDNLFRALRSQTGIYATPHMFRHTSISVLHTNGWNLELLARRSGHKSVKTTSKYYIHYDLEDVEKIFFMVSSRLGIPQYLCKLH